MKDRDERSRGMETPIPETVSKVRPTDPLRLKSRRAGSAKKLRLIRFLRQLIGQGS
jgi:hypothetical protein